MAFNEKLLTGVTLTKENFTDPPRIMGILPFWFWNGRLDEKEMEWQLREYHSKGIPGIFIHGRHGLKVPYISDDWFEKVKFAVAKAKEIGIDAWVYDEMNWPSGTAERQVLKKYPHLTQRYLELVALQVDGPLFTFLEATDSRYVNTGDSRPVAAFGCTEEEYQHGILHPIDLMRNLSFEKILPWEAPPGKWRLLYFLEKEVPYYIDALNPEATEKFIELTHERYKQAVGQEFGRTVPGFYTDEPAMHYYQVGVDNFVVPWSAQMFKIFRQRRGYDLHPYLPALYASMGEKTAQIRYDFWRTLSEQYSESYYGQIRQWCDKNGVLFTGHVLFEEWLRFHARCEGNIFHHLQHMHFMGVDHLYPKIGTEKEPAEHVALKIASSAAHQHGSTRLLCESMGGSYWDCTLERMKWMANWEYVLGVNLFNNHGYHYSIEGERKRDWPPSQFYHHTWWKYYDRFTDYMARLSHILSGGRHVAKVLILYPLTSIWTNYVPQERNAIGNVVEGDFAYLTDTLLRLHYDFDYVDEETFSGAAITDGRIVIAEEEYSALITPPMTHQKRSTFEQTSKFLKSGGNVIADTLLPVAFVDGEKDGAAREVKKMYGVDPNALLADFLGDGKGTIAVQHRNSRSNAYVLTGKGLAQKTGKETLRKLLQKCIKPDVTISDEEIFYLHRIKDGYDIYFLINTTKEAKRGVEITFEQLGQPELWDPNSGAITPLHVFQIVKGRLALTLDFPPSEARMVILKGEIRKPYITETNLSIDSFSDAAITGAAAEGPKVFANVSTSRGKKVVSAKAKKPLRPLGLGKEWAFEPENDNVLSLAHWKMILADVDGETSGYQTTDYDDSQWLDVTHGAWEPQLPQERDVQSFPATVWYRTSFEIEDMPPDTRLLIDGFSGSEYQLYLNGRAVDDKGKRSALDAEMKEVHIQPYLVPGKNLVAVRLVVTRRTDGILDLLKIIGSFALRKKRDGYSIVQRPRSLKTGDWTKQGFPFFSGTVVYRTEVNIPQQYCDGQLVLEADCGEDVLEIRINGKPGVVQPWHPYVIEITDQVRPGVNAIEIRVTNTLINILEAVEKPSGLFAPPVIRHRHRYTLKLKEGE